jgi:dodecin
VRWRRIHRVPGPGFCKLHTTCPRWRAAATTIVARNHTGAGTGGGRVGVLGPGPVVRHLCQRADRLKVREAVSQWDGGLRTVLLAAFRTQRACSAVPRVRGHRGTKLARGTRRRRHRRHPPQQGAARGPSSLRTVRGCSDSPAPAREPCMADQDPRTYKLVELVGTSPVSYAEATKNAIARAGETLRDLGWFEVTELRGLLENGAISEYQVTLKVGFRVLDRDQV